MSELLTMQDLANGHLDVKALGEAANGDENTIVTTRTGNTYPSAERAINIMFQNGGLPATPFATRALMTASALVDGDYAMVTDDTNNDNGLYIKDAGVWRRTSYTTKTNYKAIAENQDILALSVGDYYIPSFAIGDTLINMVDVSQKLGIIKVENLAGDDGYKKVTISTFANGIYVNTYSNAAWSGWRKAASINEVLAVTDDRYLPSEIKNVVENQDILQLDFGDYFVDGFSLTNLINFPPVESYKYGRIEVKQNTGNASFKIITVSTYRDPAIYINKNNETGWMGWQKIGGSSSGGSAHTPSLVMPPKIYTMSGLQAHIYPEHLLPEPSDLYLHDVDCALGKQMERGWVYDAPSGLGASTTALTWTLRDKQTASLLTSATTSIVTADSAKSGNKNVLVIGDSYINGGIITQQLLDISATDALKVSLIGTRGTAPNKHEGRGGWTVNDYATNGRLFLTFTVSGVTTPPAINAASYDYTGGSFYVQETNIVDGVGTITGEAVGAAPPSSGTLTKTNSSVGDASIAYSGVTTVSGNPFWFSDALDFGQYITSNSLATPDIVLINLGVNDSFGATSDDDAVSRATTAFAKLDNLIASIKAQNAAVKIGLIAPPSYANQDAFGLDYGNSYTSWRCSRNIVIWNSELYKRYKDSEPQNIYTVAAGLNVDTKANFPTTTQATNSHNSTVITVQSNSVHPDVSGYRQMGDSIFSLIKAVV